MRRRMILIGLAAAALAGPSHAGSTADAEAAFDKEDYERAFALYTKAIEEAGSDPMARASALFDRAEIYSRMGKTPEALADYGEALALSHDAGFKALTVFGRGDLYAQARRYPEAIADYTAALALKPDLVGVLTARGEVRRRMNDAPAALADFEAELKINPKYPRALRGRAAVLGIPDPTQVKENDWPGERVGH
jgi:tetratricopeptide (TPR) repeat protein